jgi:hypothetical protein
MNDTPATPAAPFDYKGRRIVLTSHQEAAGTWVSEYVISEPDKPQVESGKGRPDGNFPSREAAELAAVQKAKALIDLC